MSILKWEISSCSSFESFFIVTAYNCAVNFKFIHFLLWANGSLQSSNFDTFKCSGENLPSSSCHFLNRKLVFLQSLHHSSVSWKITPLYFFSKTLYALVTSSEFKCNFLRHSSAWGKICQNANVSFELTSQSLFNFWIIIHCRDK